MSQLWAAKLNVDQLILQSRTFIAGMALLSTCRAFPCGNSWSFSYHNLKQRYIVETLIGFWMICVTICPSVWKSVCPFKKVAIITFVEFAPLVLIFFFHSQSKNAFRSQNYSRISILHQTYFFTDICPHFLHFTKTVSLLFEFIWFVFDTDGFGCDRVFWSGFVFASLVCDLVGCITISVIVRSISIRKASNFTCSSWRINSIILSLDLPWLSKLGGSSIDRGGDRRRLPLLPLVGILLSWRRSLRYATFRFSKFNF